MAPDRTILLGGEAGAGLVTVGTLLAKALTRLGFSIVVNQSYMSRIRGGHNTFVVRYANSEINATVESIDILVAFDALTMDVHKHDLTPDGLVIADAALGLTCPACISVPFAELAPKRQENVAALGVLGAILALPIDVVTKATDDFFSEKDSSAEAANRDALAKAYEWARNLQQNKLLPLELPKTPPKRIMMNGNDAIALGAMSAGVKFCSFYPMTPATTIPQTLAHYAERMGLVVEQAEDEIAAINMAVGASFAGAPAMTATSGGGFALMVEGVSLAGMTETPVVIVVGQRPGPATGLPTRTEQADLEFVLHAGHGEFPRAIFAPGSVEECFYLTRKAFMLAERFQLPVFILTDQFLADSYRAVAPFDLVNLPPVRAGSEYISTVAPYRRYEPTESGVSPRLLPGASGHLVVADSDEHTADGHLTEDLVVRREMVEKRLRKMTGLKEQVLPPYSQGPMPADILLVTWGSSRGACMEAADELNARGIKTALLHFYQVWPLIPEQFLPDFEKAKRVVIVESNATGQLARVIRSISGYEIKESVLRYDGLPITPAYILHALGKGE